MRKSLPLSSVSHNLKEDKINEIENIPEAYVIPVAEYLAAQEEGVLAPAE